LTPPGVRETRALHRGPVNNFPTNRSILVVLPPLVASESTYRRFDLASSATLARSSAMPRARRNDFL